MVGTPPAWVTFSRSISSKARIGSHLCIITVGANSKLSDKYLLVVGSTVPADSQKAYTMTDANIAYHWPDNKYQIRVWVKNIENVAVIAATAGGSNLPPLTTGATAFLEPPRTYGATFVYHWGK